MKFESNQSSLVRWKFGDRSQWIISHTLEKLTQPKFFSMSFS